MTQLNEVTGFIESIASLELAADWDNTGMQIDVGKKNVGKALVALEITEDVAEEAQAGGVDLIITHHPLIFKPLSVVDYNNSTGNIIIELIKRGISVYSAHTNFDAADGGNNDYIAWLLALSNVKKFETAPIGRYGELNAPMPFGEVCSLVKGLLKLEHMAAVGNPGAQIRKIGICSGASADLIDDAIGSGCDLYLTGDVKYHDAHHAMSRGLCLIDAGHYGTEKFFVCNMAGKLSAAFGSKLEVVQSKVSLEPFLIY
ncbi:MAG: Nif3-like dinuclear metal center hexameric protein [Clostridiales bacterium]|nr:Nif3-like dinuclear metal center hexameric protein [Clostridiales bacterium]